MATADAPETGLWRRVGRPFRAVGRGLASVWGFIDFVGFVRTVAHGIASGFRALRRAISEWF
jgi:hypothetical protein